MLVAPRLRGRTASQRWVSRASKSLLHWHLHRHQRSQTLSIFISGRNAGVRYRSFGSKNGPNIIKGSDPTTKIDPKHEEEEELSLMEQLFPEEAKRLAAASKKTVTREVPRLPLDGLETPVNAKGRSPLKIDGVVVSERAAQAHQEMVEQMRQDGAETRILVLRNASTNLTEEDFYRLVPRGQHMEGWKHDQGDIVKIVPARSMDTLEQKPWYYLIFSSQLSAFTYQGHATRVHQIVQQQTPKALDSPLAPPPGFMVGGMEAHAVIKDFTLIPAGQPLELQHLKPPLAPMIDLIAKYQGYPALMFRPSRMPHELRLTLEGPQLNVSALKQTFAAAASYGDILWSGGTELLPKITQWTPWPAVSDANRDANAQRLAHAQLQPPEIGNSATLRDIRDGPSTANRRTRQKVWILGFHTAHAAQYFRQYWHRKSISQKVFNDASNKPTTDVPPIIKVERLW